MLLIDIIFMHVLAHDIKRVIIINVKLELTAHKICLIEQLKII